MSTYEDYGTEVTLDVHLNEPWGDAVTTQRVTARSWAEAVRKAIEQANAHEVSLGGQSDVWTGAEGYAS